MTFLGKLVTRSLVGIVHRCRNSLPKRGIEEFFDPLTKEHESVKTGRSWIASELRLKSHEELHRLWYVLQKERNLLVTKKLDCKRQGIPFIDKGRLIKVRKSIARLLTVEHERARAFNKALEILDTTKEEDQGSSSQPALKPSHDQKESPKIP